MIFILSWTALPSFPLGPKGLPGAQDLFALMGISGGTLSAHPQPEEQTDDPLSLYAVFIALKRSSSLLASKSSLSCLTIVLPSDMAPNQAMALSLMVPLWCS
ncbi:hypothetical protein TNCT_424581 [Trichonephila clavata]|uniref:Uncharacterized protein n=1 Tax=Trichonephila clavata TaxID=2740835 RepID=A0A8X6G390_TRICU|nr:hypothetical protein TNCT_424581 [Trichonephila clavata]